MRIINAWHDSRADLVEVGAYVTGTNPRLDKALRVIAALRQFLCQTPTESFMLFESLSKLQRVLEGEQRA
jgi:flagellum-specific ATP synthase